MTEMRMKFMEAVARRKIISARYNGSMMNLAPHLIFERHGELYMTALNLGKVQSLSDGPRLGQFKLAGLKEPVLSEESFEPVPAFDAKPPRSDDMIVLAI